MWFFSSRKARRIPTKPSYRPTFRPRVRALEDRCLMSAGTLDPTFNPAGVPAAVPPTPAGTAAVVTKESSFPYSALVQPSGKIGRVGAALSFNGGSGSQMRLSEFDPNGTLDPNFGSHGIVTNTKWSLPYSSQGCVAVLYPTGGSGDQQILVAGPSTSGTFTLARYNADGSLDTSFGKNGTVNTSFTQGVGSVGGVLDGVALVPNGSSPPKIVMAGSDANNAGVEMARYSPNGTLDTSFGSGGKLYTPIPGGIQVDALALNPVSGDLLVGGSKLVAFQSNGTLDTAFGTNGVVNSGAVALAIYPAGDPGGNAGKILASGGGVARYTMTGTLDTSWGGTGQVTGVGGGVIGGAALAIQSDDKVLVGNGAQWNVTRLNAGGSLDMSFGSGGIAGAGFRNGGGLVFEDNAVVVEPNGDIIEASNAFVLDSSYHGDSALARFLPSQPQISS